MRKSPQRVPQTSRPCDFCGVVYTPFRRTSQFCSPECKKRAAWNRHRATVGISKDCRQAAETRKRPLTQEQRQLMLGSLLGDGSIAHSAYGAFFRLCHGGPQLEYLLWKKTLLGNLVQAEPKSYQKRFRGTFNTQWHIHTILHPEIAELRKLAYPEGVKRITDDWLSRVDSLGLALWYMDDGSFLKASNSRQVVFCTEGFDNGDTRRLQKWLLERWKVESVLQPCRTRQGERFRLRINRTQTPAFFAIIHQHIPASMQYKLPEQMAFPAD